MQRMLTTEIDLTTLTLTTPSSSEPTVPNHPSGSEPAPPHLLAQTRLQHGPKKDHSQTLLQLRPHCWLQEGLGIQIQALL